MKKCREPIIIYSVTDITTVKFDFTANFLRKNSVKMTRVLCIIILNIKSDTFRLEGKPCEQRGITAMMR